ncbi:MAG: hypothetical protein OEZ65_07365 [Gemmatimonadota bacterium]|nr:hypothetical protein [Gemmatimonadota bacterium]MDH5759393.1 hypothetical protein [Gemmatimonadota bacterium]
MIHAHIDTRHDIPWWAAFGAPLLVVPLIVAALALWAPSDGEGWSGEETSQPVEVQPSMDVVDLPPDYVASADGTCI